MPRERHTKKIITTTKASFLILYNNTEANKQDEGPLRLRRSVPFGSFMLQQWRRCICSFGKADDSLVVKNGVFCLLFSKLPQEHQNHLSTVFL